MSRKPTVISLFAGCGGSSLGYKWAGFKELLAVEWDDNAVATFKLNFPRVPVYHGDIKELSGAECMKLAGVKKGELDVLDGSPPCQGFSTAGKRKLNDQRNTLSDQYVRLLQALKPKTFVMENVTGLIKGHMKPMFLALMVSLRASGYHVKAEVLNAAHYGTPQARNRVIVIGTRVGEATLPTPNVTRVISCSEALRKVNIEETERNWMLSECSNNVAFTDWEITKPGQSVSGARKEVKGFGAVKANPEKPSPTIRKSDGNIGLYGSMHWREKRRFTTNEYKRLFGFPDDFKFADEGNVEKTWSGAVSRMGNSVPPLLMKAVAEHVKQRILKL